MKTLIILIFCTYLLLANA